MPFKKGHKLSVGNKGGRRPSEKEEFWHLEKWEKDSLVDILRKKIASNCYSIRDRWLLMALEGNVVMTKQAADKVLADLHDLRGKDGKDLPGTVIKIIKPDEGDNIQTVP